MVTKVTVQQLLNIIVFKSLFVKAFHRPRFVDIAQTTFKKLIVKRNFIPFKADVFQNSPLFFGQFR